MIPGTKPTPYLQAVREGNPSRRPLTPGMVLPPNSLLEPDWNDVLPGSNPSQKRLRDRAAQQWSILADRLQISAGLVREMQPVLEEYCKTYAWLVEIERQLATDGLVIQGDRGTVRNPLITTLNQFRQHFRSLAAELGLSPASATRIRAIESEDPNDVFDTPESIAASMGRDTK